jgi:hypothetical protein
MKSDFGKLRKQFKGKMTAFIIVILLLFSSSPSLLCIEPGSHIAIENIGATCCASFEISTPAEAQPDNGLNEAGDCHNCTDILITSHVPVTASESYARSAANPFADKCSENHSPDVYSSLFQTVGSINNNDRSIPGSSSSPMRC